jgi:hypothetical protein
MPSANPRVRSNVVYTGISPDQFPACSFGVVECKWLNEPERATLLCLPLCEFAHSERSKERVAERTGHIFIDRDYWPCPVGA